MFAKIGEFTFKKIQHNIPWTNVYGLARSFMALSLMITLLFNDVRILFKPIAGVNTFPGCGSYGSISIFCLVPNDYIYLNIVKWIVIGILFLVLIGWRPRFTGIFHWWVAYSIQASAVTLDGGEQVQAVLTLFLIPLTLTDKRKWHWSNPEKVETNSPKYIYSLIIASLTFIAIRFQVSIIYLNAPLAKLKQEEWINGTAVYYFLNDSMLGMPPLMANIFNKILTTSLVVIPTWGTLIVQFLLFTALFLPKNKWYIFLVLGILMHSSFAVILGLYSFSFVMFGALLLYLRPSEMPIKFHYIKIFLRKLELKSLFKRIDVRDDKDQLAPRKNKNC